MGIEHRPNQIYIFEKPADFHEFEYGGFVYQHYSLPSSEIDVNSEHPQLHIGADLTNPKFQEYLRWSTQNRSYLSRLAMLKQEEILIMYTLPEASIHLQVDASKNKKSKIEVQVSLPNMKNNIASLEYDQDGRLITIQSDEAWDKDGLSRTFDELEKDSQDSISVDERRKRLKVNMKAYVMKNTIAHINFSDGNISLFEDYNAERQSTPYETQNLEIGKVYPIFDEKYRLDEDHVNDMYILHFERRSGELTSVYIPQHLPESFYGDIFNTESQNWVNYRDGMGIHVIRTSQTE